MDLATPPWAAVPQLLCAVVDHDDQAVHRALQRLAGAEVEVMAAVTAVIALATATLCFVAMEAELHGESVPAAGCNGSGRAAPDSSSSRPTPPGACPEPEHPVTPRCRRDCVTGPASAAVAGSRRTGRWQHQATLAVGVQTSAHDDPSLWRAAAAASQMALP